MSKPVLYFDHAATTSVYPEVIEELHQDFLQHFANPSSTHQLGLDLNNKIQELKRELLRSLQANEEDHFYFTSSATESNNTIIAGLIIKPGNIVLYSKADHPSVVLPVENLKEKGAEVLSFKLLPDGTIDLLALENMIAEKTIALAVFSEINHQSGNIYDIKRLATLIKKYSPKCHVHIDAVQAFGKIETSVSREIDSMSITAHKIGGPKGIAGLYLKNGCRVRPLLLGGGQQNGFRAGTESFPLAHAFFMAARLSLKHRQENLERISSLNRLIKESVIKVIPTVQFPFEETSPYILSFIIPGISTDIILRHLEVKNVYIGTTSACSGRVKAYNPTLDALGIPEKFHKNILRISLGPITNQADTQLFLQEFLATWNELRHFVK